MCVYQGERVEKGRRERTSWSPFWLPTVILGPPTNQFWSLYMWQKNGEGRRGHEYNLLFMNFRYFSRQTCWCQHCGFNIWQSAPRPLSTGWPGSWTPFFHLKYEFIYMGTAKARKMLSSSWLYIFVRSSVMWWVILVQRVRSYWSDTERTSFVSLRWNEPGSKLWVTFYKSA